ncbi:hypothetical protein PJF56_06380 [Roseofilum sp. BLCC_M91]|uniref:DUF3261 domain-containing protein n=1 Tax=Roseofilum halophilum BLCC-M91 TaxID=3022259 RepID=A0ABT7BH22_9CYAN|nr:hypothetical protein [Roseofilum halophilum]MDJ1178485.1 hypothetical protein [Roseofilum halophilum BLCC-M91]
MKKVIGMALVSVGLAIAAGGCTTTQLSFWRSHPAESMGRSYSQIPSNPHSLQVSLPLQAIITLADGEEKSGRITDIDEQVLSLYTGTSELTKIKWEKIASIKFEEGSIVYLPNGKPIYRGSKENQSDQFHNVPASALKILDANKGYLEIDLSLIASLNADQIENYHRDQHSSSYVVEQIECDRSPYQMTITVTSK